MLPHATDFLLGSAQAQEDGSGGGQADTAPAGSVSINWTYSRTVTQCPPFYPCTDESTVETFSGSSVLTPVASGEEGFEGSGSGAYGYSDEIVTRPATGCPNGARSYMAESGSADFVVHAHCTIDNPVTGGPDTSHYDRNTSVVEALLEDNSLNLERDVRDCDGRTEAWTSQEGSVGFGCFFYGVDFDAPGSYTYRAEVTEGSFGTCTMNFVPAPKGLRIYGTVMGQGDRLPDPKGPFPISNARVVAIKFDEPRLKKLSESKPLFTRTTTTSDDEKAEYEIELSLCDEPPRVVVASTLWHAGSPEFAVTAARSPAGTYIPVYQVLCVDDDPTTECEKWVETSDGGFEARVDFIHGSEQKLADHREIMPEESWDGPLPIQDKISESAFVYYHSYRAFEYFQALGLQVPWNELLIRLWHDEGNACRESPSTAYYDAPDFIDRKFPSFGDLGRHLESTQATGAGVYGCTQNSYTENYAPAHPLWHELGHYLQFQMYDAYDPTTRVPHAGYANESSNDSVIEGFATFMAILTNEFYGAPSAQVFAGVNLELDYKVWGSQGVWTQNPYQLLDGAEEDAVTGILWDFHDRGHEINLGQSVNGSLVPVSRVFPVSEDRVALGAPEILKVLQQSRTRTLVQLHGAFYDARAIGETDLDMIFVNHGAYADIADLSERNYVHDSDDEFTAQTGSSVDPVRLVRNSPLPGLPGSNLVSMVDATYSVSVNFAEPYQAQSYDYPLVMQAGVSVAFRMPPPYYPSKAVIFPLIDGKKAAAAVLEISSEEYWEYIRSGPEKSAVFKTIPAGRPD